MVLVFVSLAATGSLFLPSPRPMAGRGGTFVVLALPSVAISCGLAQKKIKPRLSKGKHALMGWESQKNVNKDCVDVPGSW